MDTEKITLLEQEIAQVEQEIVTIKEELTEVQAQLGTGEQEEAIEGEVPTLPELDEETKAELEARELELMQELTAKQMKLTALNKQLNDLNSGNGLTTYYEGGN